LPADENKPLLQRREAIARALEERELFLSPNARNSFDQLFLQMGFGFNLEIWMAGGQSASELNAAELFDLIAGRANDVMSALYKDLELPDAATESTGNRGPHLGFNDGAA
jgi:hypothetical protein